MGLFDKKSKELNIDIPAEAKTVTWDASINGEEYSPFKQRARNIELLKKYGTAYDQGGMNAEAIDSYGLYMLSNGWKVQSDNPKLSEDVANWLTSWDFETAAWRLVSDCLIYEYAFQEIVPTKGGGVWGAKPCPSWTFDVEKDDYGRVIGYTQYKEGLFRKSQSLDPKNMICFKWIWLWHRAWDDITRDTKAISI